MIARRFPRAGWLLLAVCVPILIHAGPPQASVLAAKFVSFWQLSENQPNIPQGGRANTIAIDPANNDRIFVASESGGLFKSTDRGLHWSHVDTLPVYLTQAVAYLPSNPNVLLVTAKADFKSNNGGGLWRSANGGATWSQAPLMIPGFTGRLSAFEISIRPGNETVFVATSQGVFSSSDTGLSWTYSDVFAAGNDHTVFSVLATSSALLAGGPGGVRRWDTSTAAPRWITTSAVGSVGDIHAFGRSPLSASHAYMVDATSALFRTEDGGVTWTPIASAPPRGDRPCGGISFVRTIQRTTLFTRVLFLYVGNRCDLHQLAAPVNLAGTSANYSGTWHAAWLDHGDTRDLAFAGNQPFLLGTDGGLHNTADGGSTWHFTGGGRDGYNALQVTEVKGQSVGSTFTTDLYFGTQDNNLWSSNIWGNIYNLYGAEGFFIEAERRAVFDADAKIAFVACGGCQNKLSGRHFTNTVPWNNAPGAAGSPAIIRNSTYVQAVSVTKGLQPGLALTEDSGATWRQFAVFPHAGRDIPKLGRSGEGDPFLTSIVYQAFRSNLPAPEFGEVNRLLRIHKRLFSTTDGTVFFPAMNGFGGLGINPTMFAWYQIYGIDRGNAFHVIAPDVVNQRMMETRDGGENWTEIPGLTNLVTDGGRLLFRTELIDTYRGPIFPIVTAVSFSPQDPNLVLIGTSEGGIFVSNNNGGTWKKIDGTDQATYITSFFWESANSVHLSTYGRGLWKLRNRRIALPSAFDELCGTACDVVSNDSSPGRPPFSGAVLVYEGTVLGARTSGSQLKEVFVTPGSSVVFTGDLNDPQWDIDITEAESVDPTGLESLPKPPKGWIAKGLVFTDGDKLTGTVFGDSEMTLVPPVSLETYGGSTESPTKGKPYINLTSTDSNGITTVYPNGAFELAATDFLPESTYEVFIDGQTTKVAVTADRTGSFATKLSAPETFGYHLVEIRAAGGKTAVDSSLFLVKHGD
jgi:photosystem II stability/assembly factor-like uncharacterized protein